MDQVRSMHGCYFSGNRALRFPLSREGPRGASEARSAEVNSDAHQVWQSGTEICLKTRTPLRRACSLLPSLRAASLRLTPQIRRDNRSMGSNHPNSCQSADLQTSGAEDAMSNKVNNLATPASDNVASFADFAASRIRRPLAYDEPRGKVLLFTGVRYDRAIDSGPSAPTPSNGSRPSRQPRGGNPRSGTITRPV